MKHGDLVSVLGRDGDHLVKYCGKHVSIVSQGGVNYKVMTNELSS